MPLHRPASDTTLHQPGRGRLTCAGSVAVRDFNKDRLAAQDLARRTDRLEALKARRRPSALTAAIESAAGPPLVRAPRRLSTSSRAKPRPSGKSEEWHKSRVHALFKELDPQDLGEVSVDDLQASFAKMNMALDDETFAKYKSQILPKGGDSVALEAFLKFHQAVWDNQPPSVRRFAGCPEAGGDSTGSLHVGLSPLSKSKQGSMRKLPSLKLPGPSQGLYKEALENEDALRAAFYRYTNGQLYLSRSQMPSVLKDLGITLPSAQSTQLDKDFFSTFCDHEFDSADENKDGKVSFQECVAYQNRYLSMMQATSLGIIKSFRTSVVNNTTPTSGGHR
ncbi:rvb2 [Symbiodinium microadriaticum]|nr:rvb2 [Symbiodinium microadriaticum]